MLLPRTIVAGLAFTLTTATASAVTIRCVSTTGPAGGEATVDFVFTVDEGEVVGGTQNDIRFDTSVLDAADPFDGSPNCELNPAIGPGTAPDKRLAKAFVEDPLRVRAIVVSQQNRAAIPPGLLYGCTFQIPAEAERILYDIEITDPVVSDVEGDRLPSNVVGCAIAVVDPPTPTATPTATPEGFCEDDEDCPDDQICIDNRCATPTPTPIGFCEETEDCPPGQVCVDNRCSTTTPTATPEGFCEEDEDCPDDQVCIDNRCATPTPIGFCEEDEDCPDDQICIDNRCATPTPIGFCEEDDDCPEDQVCVDNRCATPTPKSGGGGGGCNCSIDPNPPLHGMLNLILALLPVLWLRHKSGSRASRVESR
jgi:hypothetical protein